MFDFPNSPTVGQIITGPNGIQYQWDGVKWLAAGSLGSTPFAPAGAINDVGRNLLHNPLFNVAQRGNGPFTTNGAFTLDRWQIGFSLDTMSVVAASLSDTQRGQIGDEVAYWCLTNAFTGNAGAGAYNQMWQSVEDVRRLANKTVIVSFYACCNTGALKLGVSFDQFFGSGGSPSGPVTGTGQSVTLSTAFARYSLTFAIPSWVGKTLGTNNDSRTALTFWFSSGTTQATRAGNVGVQSGTVNLWGVQLEIGSVATPLEKPDPQQDLAKCQRFYQTGQLISAGWCGTAGAAFFFSSFLPVPFRTATVNFTVTSTAGSAGCSYTSMGTYNTNVVWIQGAGTSTGTQYTLIVSFTASADL